jgi:hypothetical protein
MVGRHPLNALSVLFEGLAEDAGFGETPDMEWVKEECVEFVLTKFPKTIEVEI